MPREKKAELQQRALEILRRLEEAYPGADCALKWGNAFELLVATILSAQATDEGVNKVTSGLFKRYPNAAAFAAASQAEIEDAIKSIGLFRNKAKSIRIMSQQLLEEHDGEVPRDMESLVNLAGVARKTANVVLGTAFGIASGVTVDTHVHRLAVRMGLAPLKLADRTQTNSDKIEKALMDLFPQDRWVLAGHALILHGRQVCTAKTPRCDACPLNDVCPQRL